MPLSSSVAYSEQVLLTRLPARRWIGSSALERRLVTVAERGAEAPRLVPRGEAALAEMLRHLRRHPRATAGGARARAARQAPLTEVMIASGSGAPLPCSARMWRM